MSKLKERIGLFKLNKGVLNLGEGFANRIVDIEDTTERIQERISEIQLKFVDKGVIEELKDGYISFGISTGYNTIIYYEYMAEDTIGGAVYVNVEPVQVDTGYTLHLVLYEEYDGHVEELDRYKESELTILIDDLPSFMRDSEKEFRKLDLEYKQKGY